MLNLDTCFGLKHLGDDVLGCPVSRGTVVQLARVGLGFLNDVCDCFEARLLRNNKNVRYLGRNGNWDEVLVDTISP
jgi:hypothetical protein